MGTVEWQQVRSAGTASDVLAAALATIGVAQTTLAALPEGTLQQINELHELESAAQALFTRAEALDELAEQATGDQAQRLFAQAQAARQQGQAAQEEAEALTEELEAQQAPRADLLRRAARTALAAVEGEIEELHAAIATFGGTSTDALGGGNGLSMSDKIALATQIGQSRRLKEIAALCGRMTRIALRVQRTKVTHPPDEVTSITTGSDLAHLLPSEIALLTDPDLEDLFFLKFAEGRLLQYDLIGSERQGQGPIIVALDGSGSMTTAMQGATREVWSKAVMLALLAVARLQKRDMAVIQFAEAKQLRTFHFPHGQASPTETLAAADFFFSGGDTVFEPWMQAALDLVDTSRYDKADVICISDGLSHVADEMQIAWQTRRREREMRAYGVLIGTQEGARLLGSLTDALLTLGNLHEDVPVLETIFDV